MKARKIGCFLSLFCLLNQAVVNSTVPQIESYGGLPVDLKDWEAMRQGQQAHNLFKEVNQEIDQQTIVDGAMRAKKNIQEYDYVIVGLGTAGAVLARELSDPDKKGKYRNSVLVIESGENRTDDPIVTSSNPFTNLNEITYNPKYAFDYPVRSDPSNGPVYIYSAGRMWGGSSAKNYLLAVRGTPAIYNSWALMSGNSDWTYDNLLPLMKKLETFFPNSTTVLDPAQRGTSGPLDITQSPPFTATQQQFAQVESTITGAPIVSDYNNPAEGITGISVSQQFITPPPNSQRSFSISAFLPVGQIISANGRGLNGRKLRIVSDALASRVLFNKKNKAIGVEYILSNSTTNKVVQVYARKKVILSAGVAQSPAILQRSGIGDPALLNSLNIPVVVANPNVGANLMDHYGPVAQISIPTSASAGPLAFIDARPYMPADNVRRLQFISTPAGPGSARIIAWILKPQSNGSVNIVTRDATVYPDFKVNFYTDGSTSDVGSDAYLAVSAYKIIRDLAVALGGQTVYPPPADYASDAKLLADAKANTNLGFHGTGTARMAISSADGVVDGHLHVFGVKNLMVADASIEPIATNGNTAYGAYVIGLEAARIIKAEDRGGNNGRHHHSSSSSH